MAISPVNPVNKLVVIGVGLIGGSFALALRRAGLVRHVTGVGRGRGNLEAAQRLGIVDDWTADAAEAVKGADMVLLAVPMGAYESVLASIDGTLSPDAIVTDAGSTKQHALLAAKKFLSDPSRFVAAHPLAGTEQSGAAAAFAELFDKRLCILTPDAATDAQAVARVKELWEAAGATVLSMPAAEHDDFLAAVSHLPHLAAFALVNAVRKEAERNDEPDPFRFAAGGFRDFTRIASSSPEMWRDIALANRKALMIKLDALQMELSGLRRMLDAGDGESLLLEFADAKAARDAWLQKHGGSK
ncbi:MAG TPA: prephenate dehydrogenase/arogenate dehydrogenase family protein [Mariprofundaceae bacterium]|nr:prephenate dehydrogenase/arogenate dehydrogenase family protein [Mariprofundaceae bacterium]